MRLKSFMLLSGLAPWLFAATARADLVFALTPALQSGLGSNEIAFTGTFTNTSLTDNLFLNDIHFCFTGTATYYLTADTNVFFGNVPGILLPGEIYSDIIFAAAINPTTPPGNYCGIVTIQGGSDIFAADNLAGQAFQISLPPAVLGIALCGTNLVLSWASPPGDYVLQQNSNLTTTNWLNATGSQNQVILSPSAGSQFYRLEYP